MQNVPARVSEADIAEAIDQLLSNDRGRRAAIETHTMLEDYGLSLDGSNWRALEILARAGSQGGQATVRNMLAERLDPVPET